MRQLSSRLTMNIDDSLTDDSLNGISLAACKRAAILTRGWKIVIRIGRTCLNVRNNKLSFLFCFCNRGVLFSCRLSMASHWWHYFRWLLSISDRQHSRPYGRTLCFFAYFVSSLVNLTLKNINWITLFLHPAWWPLFLGSNFKANLTAVSDISLFHSRLKT